VNADDFGRSQSINQAVARAHTEGILTTASLMVNEPACEEAVALARRHPSLGVGLHLTLLLGRSGLPHRTIPALVHPRQEFRSGPVGAGFRFFFQRSLREPLRAEIHEQFRRFRETGLPLDHVNGHLHMHLHPVILDLLMKDAALLGLQRVRLTCDPLALNRAISRGRNLYRYAHAAIYRVLSGRARRAFARHGIRHTDHVFGLLQNARVDERYVLDLLPRLPRGDSELYSHPSLDEFRHEFNALVSPSVKAAVARQGIQLVRYQDL
jgi:hopanoid biosynthesis associated protein HpnK